jgi:two-component system sensor histidine kinase/response regulator
MKPLATSGKESADILVVDDTPANLKVLTELLKTHHYKVRAVPSGKLALQAIRLAPPDLILLDINMPEMNGYEVCLQLKKNQEYAEHAEIPVIFISAMGDIHDKVNAFNYGGVDYISKPFQMEEVLARLKTHLALGRLQQELRQKNADLEQQIQQLHQLEALRDSLTHMIVHDLRSPLSGIITSLYAVSEHLPNFPARSQRYLDNATHGAEALLGSINTLLDLGRLEAGEMPLNYSRFHFEQLLQNCIQNMLILSEKKGIHFELTPLLPCLIEADRELLARVIINLLSNALKFSPPQTPVQLRLQTHAQTLRLEIQDQGPGISDTWHEKIFVKFGQAEIKAGSQGPSTGLGLAFCKLAIEAHRGQIGIESEVGRGSTFWFELPLQACAENLA